MDAILDMSMPPDVPNSAGIDIEDCTNTTESPKPSRRRCMQSTHAAALFD
jgi:hypothetical protein